MIGEIGEWVFEEACRQLGRWRAEGVVDEEAAVSVNLSVAQLTDGTLPGRVARILDRHGIPARNLIVEITESVFMEERRMAEEQLDGLRRLGTVIALDDFGTGYSSLSRLASLPVDYLKVDRSFVSKIHTLSVGNPLTASILAMGRSLGLRVVAEGVETVEQLTALRRLGCEFVQGYLLARPVPPAEIPALVEGPLAADELTSPVPMVRSEVEAELAELIPSIVLGGDDLEDLARLAVAELQKITALDSVYLTRIDWDGEQQQVMFAANAGGTQIGEGLTVPWSDTLCRRALADGRRHTSDVPATYPDSEAAAELGLRSFVSIPVKTPDGSIVGTLCGASGEPVEVPDNVLTLIELFARLLGERLAPVLRAPSRRPGVVAANNAR